MKDRIIYSALNHKLLQVYSKYWPVFQSKTIPLWDLVKGRGQAFLKHLLRRKSVLVFSLIFLLGLYIRLVNLDTCPGFERDEGFYSDVAENLSYGKFMTLSFHFEPRLNLPTDIQPQYMFYNMPLWFILVAISFSLFGVGVFQVRIVSVLFDMLTAALVFRFGKELYSERTGFLAMLIYSLDFYSVYIGRLAEHDNVEAFFVILSIYLWYQASKKENNIVFLMLSGISAGLAVLSKIIGLITLGIILGLTIVRILQKNELKKRVIEFVLPTVFCVLVVIPYIIIAYSIAGDIFLTQTFYQFYHGPGENSFLASAPRLLSFARNNPLWFIAGFGFGYMCLKREESDFIMLVWLFVLFIFFANCSLIFLRYIAPMYAPISLSSSRMLSEIYYTLFLDMKGRFNKILYMLQSPLSLIVILIYLFSIIAIAVSTEKIYSLVCHPNCEIFDVADYLDTNVPIGTKIIGQPALSFISKNHTLYALDHIMKHHKGGNQYEVNYQRIRKLPVKYIILDPFYKSTPGISPDLELFLEEYCIIETQFSNTEIYRIISYDF